MKKDLIFSFILGETAGVFLVPTLLHTGLYQKIPYAPLVLFVLIPLASVAGFYIAAFLSKFLAVLKQFSRFIIVGFANASIDFGILNILSALTGITAGIKLIPFNIVSFAFAVTHSFLWNKFWVFEEREGGATKEFRQFILVTVVGLAINSAVVVIMTSAMNPTLGLTPAQWENVAKIFATVFSLVWNFSGYKFLVFKKEAPPAVFKSII